MSPASPITNCTLPATLMACKDSWNRNTLEDAHGICSLHISHPSLPGTRISGLNFKVRYSVHSNSSFHRLVAEKNDPTLKSPRCCELQVQFLPDVFE